MKGGGLSPVRTPKSAGEGGKGALPHTHLQFVESLDAGGKPEVVHLHGEGGLPVLGRQGGGDTTQLAVMPPHSYVGREAPSAPQRKGRGGNTAACTPN